MVMYMIELKSIIVLFVNILKSEQVDSGRPDLAVMKPLSTNFVLILQTHLIRTLYLLDIVF